MPIPCWTILYSATKNGETKCGECYSNAISVSAAKTDCLAKLERFGYGNISILAIEAGDSDCAKITENELRKGHTNTFSITEAEEEDETGEDVSDTGDDSAEAGDNMADDDTAGEDAGEDVGDDAEGENDSEDSADDTGDDDGGEEETGDDSENDDSDSDDSDSDNGDDNSGEGKELSDEEKSALKDEYTSTFREVMLSCKFEGRSFIDLTIPEKTQFFSALNVKWKKNDPKDFMSEEEQDQLESIVVNP